MAVTLNYAPHAAQLQIHEARGKRFRSVCTGRRFGKTMCLAAELLDRGGSDPATPQELAGGHGQAGYAAARKTRDYGWVAPTYNVADRGIEAFRTIAERFIQVCGRAPSRVEFTGPAGPVRVWFLSADNPDNIRGFGFHGLVIDEAAAIPADVWHYVLRPTIAQTLGWAVFVSTPKGRNWFYDLFTRGMDPSETDYASFRFPSKASPYFPGKEWEEARRTLPADVFRQEYEAEFLEDSAGVFRNIEACLIPEIEPRMDAKAREGEDFTRRRGGRGEEGGEDGTTKHANSAKVEYVRNVVIGCDVAKHTDWTVLIAMDAETGRCFAMERFNHLDWPIQKERIVGFARKYRGRVILDASGVGDPIFDDLKRVIPDIEGFKFTAHSKAELVQRLIVAVEQRRVSWPGFAQGATPRHAGFEWEVLTNEMRRYEYAIGSSGGITYNAPAGYHDDCVMALALANHRRWETESCGRMLAVGGGRRGIRGRGRERVVLW